MDILTVGKPVLNLILQDVNKTVYVLGAVRCPADDH